MVKIRNHGEIGLQLMVREQDGSRSKEFPDPVMIKGGHEITEVPDGFVEKWAEQNPDNDIVRNKLLVPDDGEEEKRKEERRQKDPKRMGGLWTPQIADPKEVMKAHMEQREKAQEKKAQGGGGDQAQQAQPSQDQAAGAQPQQQPQPQQGPQPRRRG